MERENQPSPEANSSSCQTNILLCWMNVSLKLALKIQSLHLHPGRRQRGTSFAWSLLASTPLMVIAPSALPPSVKCYYRSLLFCRSDLKSSTQRCYDLQSSLNQLYFSQTVHLSNHPTPLYCIYNGVSAFRPGCTRLTAMNMAAFWFFHWDCQWFKLNWTLVRWVIHHLQCDNTCNYCSYCYGWNSYAVKGS